MKIPAKAPIKVLVVDDSALMRQLLTELLSADPGIKVVGGAPDPLVARAMIKEREPDVLTLDVEMPRMDGLTFLEKLMALRPMPVVMVSSLTQSGADATLRALELGAVDFVGKPQIDLRAGMKALQADLVEKVKAAARARPRPTPRPAAGAGAGTGATGGWGAGLRSSEKVIAIGASTGGVEALREVVCALPPDGPAVLVVQHMPPFFTASFAARLNGLSAVSVTEAKNDARALPGHVYIAPGGSHLELARSGANYVCRVSDGPLVSGHRPSVDMLFNSVARVAGDNAVGAILTGMGRDGVDGLLAMRQAGAMTIGQDEASCVVYGMPKAAHKAGATQVELPLGKIPAEIIHHCRKSGHVNRV